MGLVEPLTDGNDTAVHTPHPSVRGKDVQIPANGRLGDAERRAELIEPRRAARLHDRRQPLPALDRKVMRDLGRVRSLHN
jgi:hypothetical protein